MIKELVHDEAILSTPCEPATAEDAALAAVRARRGRPPGGV